jgi:hypothetical protein
LLVQCDGEGTLSAANGDATLSTTDSAVHVLIGIAADGGKPVLIPRA